MKEEVETNEIENSFNVVLKGSSLVLIGTLIAGVLSLVYTIIIARYWTKTDLGIFTLAASFLGIFSTIGSLGIARAVTRNIAYYKGKKDYKTLPNIIISSIVIIFVVSSILAIIMFIFSGYIAENILQEPALKLPLMIFSVAIPINNIITILTSVFKGFNNIKPRVFFEQIFFNFLFFIFIILLVFFNARFIYVFYFYLAAVFITSLILVIYTYKKTPKLDNLFNLKLRMSQAKPLLLFSLPILGIALLNTSTNWANIWMLGLFKSAADVGVYKVANVVTGFIGFPIGILLALYLPVISNLYAKNKIDEIKRIYTIITKWICFFTFPMFIFLFIFTEPFISWIYGNEYIIASDTLRILSFAIISTNFAGPNAPTLISLGKPRLVMYSLIISSLINIILNILLIPNYGIEGAAISMAVSLICFNLIKCGVLYISKNIHPISYNLIKPTILMVIFGTIIYLFWKDLFYFRRWMVPILVISFYLIYFVFFLISKSIDKEDIDLLKNIQKKIRIRSNLLVKIMKRFMS